MGLRVFNTLRARVVTKKKPSLTPPEGLKHLSGGYPQRNWLSFWKAMWVISMPANLRITLMQTSGN